MAEMLQYSMHSMHAFNAFNATQPVNFTCGTWHVIRDLERL
jgi:hypothetical protein